MKKLFLLLLGVALVLFYFLIKDNFKVKKITKQKTTTAINKKQSTTSLITVKELNKIEVEINPVINEEKIKLLENYSELRKKLVFKNKLSSLTEKDFKGKLMLKSAEQYLTKTSIENSFDSENEKIRIMLIDYIGDVYLENLKFEDHYEAEIILTKLLFSDPIKKDMEHQQKKSLIGDKIDLMSLYTQKDKDRALNYLLSKKSSKYYSFLKDGYLNGLFFIGQKKEYIDHMRRIL